jgi:restriction system protein
MVLAIILVVAALVVGSIVGASATKQQPPSGTAVDLARRLESVRYMSGMQFEHFTADVLRGLGFHATPLGGSGDQGVEVIARKGNEKIAVQCKNYDRPIGNKPVQEVYAGARHHRCTRAWVIAPAGFTKGATDLARSVGVSLYDSASLRTWIRQTSTPMNLGVFVADDRRGVSRLPGSPEEPGGETSGEGGKQECI